MKRFLSRFAFTSTLKNAFILSLLVGLYSIFPLVENLYIHPAISSDLSEAEAVFGIVIGLILIFRANRCYERWQEARALWGNLTSISRNLAIKFKSLTTLNSSQTKVLSKFITDFATTLKDQLQKTSHTKDKTLTTNVGTIMLVDHFYLEIKSWREQKLLSTEEFWIIDQELRNFIPVAGGCERINNTLIPLSFRTFSLQIISIFIFILPWIYANSLGYMVIVFTIIFSYLILGLEQIAHNLEIPFGNSEDHLDLGKFVSAITQSVEDILHS